MYINIVYIYFFKYIFFILEENFNFFSIFLLPIFLFFPHDDAYSCKISFSFNIYQDFFYIFIYIYI
jgi:hypothetical protein